MRSRFVSWAVLLLAAGPLAGPASASFRVCNQTLDLLNVAVGTPAEDGFGTEGWWVVTANSCSEIIRHELESRFIYLFATDVYGQSIVAGAEPMCVGRDEFRILGTDDCYLRGYSKADFKEIDTFSSKDWTVYVTR